MPPPRRSAVLAFIAGCLAGAAVNMAGLVAHTRREEERRARLTAREVAVERVEADAAHREAQAREAIRRAEAKESEARARTEVARQKEIQAAEQARRARDAAFRRTGTDRARLQAVKDKLLNNWAQRDQNRADDASDEVRPDPAWDRQFGPLLGLARPPLPSTWK
jgi:hypothetical protein